MLPRDSYNHRVDYLEMRYYDPHVSEEAGWSDSPFFFLELARLRSWKIFSPRSPNPSLTPNQTSRYIGIERRSMHMSRKDVLHIFKYYRLIFVSYNVCANLA
jgi:hypothetical protein